jgi:hypothetical protein
MQSRTAEDNKTTNQGGGELALVMATKKFKGHCGLCGKFGHKRVDCHDGKTNLKLKINKDMMCTFCKKKGHTEPFCFAKKHKEREASDTKTNDPGEMFLVATNLEEKNTPIDPSIWIADSGATLHASNSLVGMFDLENCQVCITVGNGKQVTSLKKGKKKITINQKHGQNKIITLLHVQYVPELICNLFSVTSTMSNGGVITSDGFMLTVTKGNQQITFNHQIWTNQGYLLGIKTKHFQGEVAMPITVKGMKVMKKIDINDLHIILCHANKRYVCSTAKKYD